MYRAELALQKTETKISWEFCEIDRPDLTRQQPTSVTNVLVFTCPYVSFEVYTSSFRIKLDAQLSSLILEMFQFFLSNGRWAFQFVSDQSVPSVCRVSNTVTIYFYEET